MTCVSGYFPVKNKHGDSFDGWFENTLSINCPYVFFGTKETIEKIKEFRKDLPTTYIEYDIPDFATYKYKDKMIADPSHCPSVELNLIWNEKIFMLKKAAEMNPYDSEWFQWVDAGICVFRNEKPPTSEYPNRNDLVGLPKDKFIYSSSYPHEEGTSVNSLPHHIAGTSYLLHKTFINTFADIYNEYLDKVVSPNQLWTDQILLTRIYKEKPELFFKLTHDYGALTKELY